MFSVDRSLCVLSTLNISELYLFLITRYKSSNLPEKHAELIYRPNNYTKKTVIPFIFPFIQDDLHVIINSENNA